MEASCLPLYTINVEHELALVTTIDQGTLYAQGNQNVVIANVHVATLPHGEWRKQDMN